MFHLFAGGGFELNDKLLLLSLSLDGSKDVAMLFDLANQDAITIGLSHRTGPISSDLQMSKMWSVVQKIFVNAHRREFWS